MLVVLCAFGAMPAVAAACNDSWTNAAGGSWATAGNWSAGVPTSSSDVCITLAGTYTVTVPGITAAANSLTLGGTSGTQTLDVQGPGGGNGVLSLAANSTVQSHGQLKLDSLSGGGYADVLGASGTILTNNGSIVTQVAGGNVDYLEIGLTNNGTVDVHSGEWRQDQGTTTTNAGTWIVDPGGSETLTSGSDSFLNDAGSVTDNGSITLSGASWSQAGGTESGAAVTMFSGTFDDGGTASSGTFDLIDSVNATGTIAAGEKVNLDGIPGHNAQVNVVGGLTNDGLLVLDSQTGGGGAYLYGNPVVNNGTIDTQDAGSGDFLQADLTNNGAVDVQSGELRQDQGTTTTNNGTFTTAAAITPGYTITAASGSFVNNFGGAVTNHSAITLSSGASWTQHGGNESGNPVSMFSGTLTDNGAGSSGSFELIDGPTISGTISPGETVDLTGIPGHNAVANLAGPSVTNDGTVILDSQNSGGSAYLTGNPLINNGTLTAQVETGGQLDFLEAALTNNPGALLTVSSGELRQDAGTTTANKGTVTVANGAQFNLTAAPDLFLNNSTGSVGDNGSISLSSGASWQQAGGSETGNPVSMFSGTLTDNGAGSSASFELIDGPTISGTIAPGETVDLTALPGHNASANLASPGVTNDGTLILDSQNSGGYTDLTGNPLTNDGTMTTQVETGGQLDYLQAALTNNAGASLTISSGTLQQDAGTTTTNQGTITVANGAQFNLLGSDTLANDSTGSVSNGGSMTFNGATWTQNGGSQTGNPVSMFSGTLSDNGAGTGSFELIDSSTISGAIAPGQTVDITAIPGHNSVPSLQSPGVTNNGTLILDSQPSGGSAYLTGSLLTNNGTLRTQVESGGQLDYLEAPLTNNAGASVTVATGTLQQDANTTTTNKGTVTVAGGAQFNLLGSESFLNASTGSVSNGGSMTFNGGTWTQNGGSETGNPASFFSGTLSDNGAGTGSFELIDSSTISGAIAPGQTVDITGIPGHDAAGSLAGLGVTNNGTLILDSQPSGGYADLTGSLLTNNGTLRTQVEGGGNLDYLQTNVVNSGTIDVATGVLRQDSGTTTTNNGNVILEPAGQFDLTVGSDTFNQQPGSTMTFDITGPSSYGTLNLSGGAVFNLNGGTADPMLQGGYSPPVTTPFDVITGPWGSGTFTTVANGFTADYSNPAVIRLIVSGSGTATGLASSLNPSTSGTSVTFTATVTHSTGSANPTGTVTFFDNGTSIGTGTLSTTAGVTRATLASSSLSVGTHPITATYAGDSNYAGSSSATVSQVVNLNGTNTTVGSSANPSTPGQSVTFTATVAHSSGSANPTGAVTFYDNGTAIGAGTLSTTAGATTATFATSSLPVGAHPITAAYGGDSNYSGSTSPALNQVVKTGTTTTLANSQDPSPVGQSVTFTATVAHTTGSANPTGTVTFYDNGTSIGTGTLSTAGGATTATLATSTLTVGTHPITASYGGDSNYSGSSSPALDQVVNAPVHQTQNQPLTVSGAGQGGSVSVNGQSCNGTCTFSYSSGQLVTLTATAQPGWTFAGWSGAGCIGTGSCVVTMSAAQNVKALFIHLPPPVFQRNSDTAAVSGKVTVRLPGTNRFVALSSAKQIPLGAVIDATHGTVQVVLAKPGGGTLEAQYWTGQFALSQARNGLVTAKLQGGIPRVCTARGLGHARDASAAAHRPRHRQRSLWSNVHGTFTTQGSYASGTVRGTEWFTVDYCEGTSVQVIRGAVLVTDLRRHRHTLVRAGHSIFVSR